jgi:GNAT superfamily N-acetyltransferase
MTAGLPALTSGFNRGFQDYKYGMQFDYAQMMRYLDRSGVKLAHSSVLLVEETGSWQGAGIALLALAGHEAWCGGLAVAPEYRLLGLAHQLMTDIQKRALDLGATLLTLEVLVDNIPARRLYHALGYRETRQLLIWEHATQAEDLVFAGCIRPASPDYIITGLHHWHIEPTAWQRSAHALHHLLPYLRAFILDNDRGLPMAYALCQTVQNAAQRHSYVRISDINADPRYAPQETIRPLIQGLIASSAPSTLTLLNEPEQSPFNTILSDLGFQVVERQFEMRRDLLANPAHSA